MKVSDLRYKVYPLKYKLDNRFYHGLLEIHLYECISRNVKTF